MNEEIKKFVIVMASTLFMVLVFCAYDYFCLESLDNQAEILIRAMPMVIVWMVSSVILSAFLCSVFNLEFKWE